MMCDDCVKVKKQKHDLTHVEIWLGDGPKTIGARWQKGKVQVFDSYQFNATSYHSPVYIFKSIETWLMGICRRCFTVINCYFKQLLHFQCYHFHCGIYMEV